MTRCYSPHVPDDEQTRPEVLDDEQTRPEVPNLLADAWEEGFKAGDRYGTDVAETHAGYRDSLPVRPENPYGKERDET